MKEYTTMEIKGILDTTEDLEGRLVTVNGIPLGASLDGELSFYAYLKDGKPSREYLDPILPVYGNETSIRNAWIVSLLRAASDFSPEGGHVVTMKGRLERDKHLDHYVLAFHQVTLSNVTITGKNFVR